MDNHHDASGTLTAQLKLRAYSGDIQFSQLVKGTDNIHYDVFLSPRFSEFSRRYIFDLVRHATNVSRFYGESKPPRPAETVTFKKLLTDLLQASLTQAKYRKTVEVDLLLRLTLMKFFTQEIGHQISNLVLECKEWIRSRGAYFEGTEQAHVKKVFVAEMQADRRNIYRQVGNTLYQIFCDLEDGILRKSRKALFGADYGELYDLLRNPLVFVEGGKDDQLFLENYVLLGNYVRDPDRFETFDLFFLEFLREVVFAGEGSQQIREAWQAHEVLARQAEAVRGELGRLEAEKEDLAKKLGRGEALVGRLLGRDDTGTRSALRELEKKVAGVQQRLDELAKALSASRQKAEFVTESHHSQIGDYLNEPENGQRLFDPELRDPAAPRAGEQRARLLNVLIDRLQERELLHQILASYELRNIYLDYCPPLHLQQLRKALISREEMKKIGEILHQFPARRFSLDRIESIAKNLRRYPADQIRAVALRFAVDFMRLRRDVRNAQRLGSLMESVTLVGNERTRELSRLNNTLYEFHLPEELRPAEDRITSHAVIKVDVRESTRITHDLLTRGLNPASHFSLILYEPVRRLLERYGAEKVFIEGDAIILALYETEANRAQQRAVAKACLLARQILKLVQTYNARAESSDLPALTIGLGIAFQDSQPTIWMEGDSRIMISRALNLSDRLSSCSKLARRLVAQNESPFNLFVFQPVVDATAAEEVEEFLIRYNVNGIQLNEEGFAKLSEEVALTAVEVEQPLPWGNERVLLYYGEVPLSDSIESLVLRKGVVRQLISGGRIGEHGDLTYYEVCTHPQAIQLVESRLSEALLKG